MIDDTTPAPPVTPPPAPETGPAADAPTAGEPAAPTDSAAPTASAAPTGSMPADLVQRIDPVSARLSGPVPSVVVNRPGSMRHVSKASRAAEPLERLGEVDDGTSAAAGERPGGPPWTRILLAIAVGGPALWLGGVPAAVVPCFLGVVLLLWLRLCLRAQGGPLRVPYGSMIGAAAAGVTLLQWLPLPRGLREWLAPELVTMTATALAGSGQTPWPGVSPVPGDSALEAARLLGLTALYIAAAQLSWRVSAALVAGLGSLVALLGLVQAGLGVRTIYGFYRPSDVDPAQTPALLSSFVNPNHQAGLFLLGIFSAAALAVYFRLQAQETSDPTRLGRARERSIAALAGVALQGVALLLSLSRGAMAAVIVVAPIALMIAWSRDGKGRAGLWLRRVALVSVFAGLGAALARQSGAWAELATLARTAEPGFETKFRVAQDAVALVQLSPVLGIGRGAFRDLFPAIDTQPVGVIHTHLESTPVAMLVEWGPFAGGAIGLGLLWWWIAAMYSSGGRQGRPRRIALCGVLALGVHSVGDFSLEFLGVTAPLCALAGSLSERRMVVQWTARGAARLGGVVLIGALGLALWAVPHSWQRRERAAEAGDLSHETSLRTRPLDADLHTRLAFQAASEDDWERARARALVATRLRPDAADPWWLLTAAEHGLGHAEESARALARTLAVVRKPLPQEVVTTLLDRYPNAEELATRMPEALAPWTLVMESIIPIAPTYAAILAAARNQVERQEPEVLRLQVRIALATENPTLARYHALLLRQLAPDEASSHLLLIQSLRSFTTPREREIQAAALIALERAAISDPAELGLIEEELVASWLREETPQGRKQARELVDRLLTRPGDRNALQRRNALREAALAP